MEKLLGSTRLYNTVQVRLGAAWNTIPGEGGRLLVRKMQIPGLHPD